MEYSIINSIKLSPEEVIIQSLKTQNPEELQNILLDIGIQYFLWHTRLATTVEYWDKMPKGFLETYFGLNADAYCPTAWKLRQYDDPYFTLEESRNERAQHEKQTIEAIKTWHTFGIFDGLAVLPQKDVLCVYVQNDYANIFKEQYSEALIVLSFRLTKALKGRGDLLTAQPREFVSLSEREYEVLRAEIDNPTLKDYQLARLIGISKASLQKYRKKISDKLDLPYSTALRLYETINPKAQK